MNIQEYLSHPGISTQDLVAALRSAAHYKNRTPEPATPAMAFGTALHCAVLQPDEYRATYVVAPDMDKRTRAWKEWCNDNVCDGQRVLSTQDHYSIEGMLASIAVHKLAHRLLTAGDVVLEQSILWDDGGMPCKSRPDVIRFDDRLAVDLKTASDAGYRAFQRSIVQYSYHIQAAHALAGLSSAWPGQWGPWLWIVVEKDPPYAVAVYSADDLMIGSAQRDRAIAMDVISRAERTGKFPAYSEEIESIGLPAWAE